MRLAVGGFARLVGREPIGATNTIAVLGDAVIVYGTGLMSVFQGFRIGGNE